ncbi:PglL family O-oligosaccharyltransferase [Caldimonas tepidiphila]|uniref:PglL family O-oligosaccharyltransferase n=1 Tax=Caldimonas tepidiphila TaxID=2315841 RepID=UPI001472ECA3|nr:O-antigen ligase family protein [Caldimonas tepidiphila]
MMGSAACFLLGLSLVAKLDSPQGVLAGLFAGYAWAVGIALAVCVVQFFVPEWAGNTWITSSQTPGRAVGNLRQPNLQATLLVWGAIAAAWLGSRHAGWRRSFPLLLTGAMFTVALTGSRTGMLLSGLLMLWGICDRLLPTAVRVMLALSPLLLAASMKVLSWWTWYSGGSYFAEARAQSGSDISSSRFAIWSNTLDLIRAQPWTGVGWGNFNFAWTLTAFENRPVAFFDHTHNLPLQLAVELGVPAAMAICTVFLWLNWRARGALVLSDPSQAGLARTTLVMLAAVLFHSLLEYPLWYAYFLLPSAFLWGIYLGLGCKRKPSRAMPAICSPAPGVLLIGAGATTLLVTLYAVWDYQRITQIFTPRGEAGARPLAERIDEGRRSMLFGASADYAAVTMAARPSEVFEAFERPLHRLIDARLMIAYARALDERGERDKAVYVAQRLREFRHPLGEKFFSACEAPQAPGTAAPFQCERTPVRLSFRDFQASAR